MKRKKPETFAHAIHLEELHEMEEFIPMTLMERNRLRNWVYSGHSVNENPWHNKDSMGYEMNYVDGYRRHLEEKWGEFYRPFYKAVRTDPMIYREDYDELSF